MPFNLISLKYIDMKKILIAVLLLCSPLLKAQVELDGIVAVVGSNIILKSDIEQQILQYQSQGLESDSAMRSQVLEDQLFQKLLLHQAELDSVFISENEVNNEIESRLKKFILQFGSEEQLEEYFDKKVYEIREEMYDPIENFLLSQRMRFGITADVSITPAEVRAFFAGLPQDSLPMINEEVEVSQIMKLPPASASAIKETKNKLKTLRQRVLDGESFATLAILYSEDPGSSRNGGLYKGIKRGMFVKEFEAIMFSLEQDEVSEVFETEYGYHIAQLDARNGEEVDVRHVLMSPKISPIDLNEAKRVLDSVKVSIENYDITFEKASLDYSDDKATKYNAGKMINPNTGNTHFEVPHLDKAIAMSIEGMEVGALSAPIYLKMPDGKEAYRLLLLRSRKEAHIANLKDDYKRIYDAALADKQEIALHEWVSEKLVKTYVKIDPSYISPYFQYNWIIE
jgi:peptidyl-prolyl cis-trans isomerase SurA